MKCIESLELNNKSSLIERVLILNMNLYNKNKLLIFFIEKK